MLAACRVRLVSTRDLPEPTVKATGSGTEATRLLNPDHGEKGTKDEMSTGYALGLVRPPPD